MVQPCGIRQKKSRSQAQQGNWQSCRTNASERLKEHSKPLPSPFSKQRRLLHLSIPRSAASESRFIAKSCKAIANKLRGKAGRTCVQQSTPGALKHIWARKKLTEEPIVSFPDPPPPWSDAPSTYHNILTVAKVQQQKHLRQIKAGRLRTWTDSWKSYQNRVGDEPSIAQMAPLDKKRAENPHPVEESRECSGNTNTN